MTLSGCKDQSFSYFLRQKSLDVDKMRSTTEMNAGIVAGCLPVLQPLFQRIRSCFSRLYSTIQNRTRGTNRTRSGTLVLSPLEQSQPKSGTALGRESADKASSTTLDETWYSLQSARDNSR